MAALSSWFISVVVITLDFDFTIAFQQPRFEPGMDLIFHSWNSATPSQDNSCISKTL